MKNIRARKWCALFSPLFVFILAGVAFHFLEVFLPPLYYMYSPLDAWIPFVPAMVIPYLSWYLYLILPAVWFFFRDRESFLKLTAFLALGMLLSCLTFLVFPNGQGLRPPVLPEGFFADLIAKIYEVDTPTNSMPSMHVMFTLGGAFALHEAPALRGKKLLLLGAYVWCALICLSTVMIKQHSVFDAAAGFLYAAAIWPLLVPAVLRLYKKRGILCEQRTDSCRAEKYPDAPCM